jgi:hypothetical protein
MIPLPTVVATAVVTKAPARFATAATKTAVRGESARVETEVATALAVSWNPFVKSKPSADDHDPDQYGVHLLSRAERRAFPVRTQWEMRSIFSGS